MLLIEAKCWLGYDFVFDCRSRGSKNLFLYGSYMVRINNIGFFLYIKKEHFDNICIHILKLDIVQLAVEASKTIVMVMDHVENLF